MQEQEKSKCKIIVGLGNPGIEYENTYHNVGMMMLFRLAGNDWKGKRYKNSFESEKKDDVVLIRPLVFMNESGLAIKEAARVFKAKPEEIVIIHDDSDIPLGSFKISFGKNAGGHNGIQSIIDTLKSKNFSRIRIGIRPIIEPLRKKAGIFVLKPITKKDKNILDGVFKEIESKI